MVENRTRKTAKRKTPRRSSGGAKRIETLIHDDASRLNIPTAEYQSVMDGADQSPLRLAYERRNRDLDPQLVWRGKDERDWSDLIVQAPPLFIQEKVHPKVLIDDLLRRSENAEAESAAGRSGMQTDLFADFNGVAEGVGKTEFYKHEQNWSNRMILGDSLQVMASLAEREGLRGKVQCIYLDPPYGIKFNSNFQWSTTSRDVKDGKADHITREPEQVKAFRDTWRDGIHSYLTYLRDRLTVARDLLTDSGSIFVQIGDENVHLVRAVMDEVFGAQNHICVIAFAKTATASSSFVPSTFDYLIWYGRKRESTKFRTILREKSHTTQGASEYYNYMDDYGFVRRIAADEYDNREIIKRCLRIQILTSQTASETTTFSYDYQGKTFFPGTRGWSTNIVGMQRLEKAHRLHVRTTSLNYIRFLSDYPVLPLNNRWDDTAMAGWSEDKRYVVQTARRVIERCLLLSTDPGDLVLDPTCGSGTTATMAEQWGRRWITIDTSRVALALARARIMGARYPYYLLADSREGQFKEAEVSRAAPSSKPACGNIRHGFVYERVPHITLKSIANNAEIDVIWDRWQAKLEPLREQLNAALAKTWQDWEVPREVDAQWPDRVKKVHADWWRARIGRQQEIDSSIAARAEFEYLYDKPYQDKNTVRVAGPFTVESLSPHRALSFDEDDELIDRARESHSCGADATEFTSMVLENLKIAGVQQAHKADKIEFSYLIPWPGELIVAEGRYHEGADHVEAERRAAIFIGPEFGTVSRPDLVSAAREAGDAGFDVLIACAFSYDAHASDFGKLGPIAVLRAHMNADLHMAEDLKSTGKGNLFVVFGEPDIDLLPADGLPDQIQVKINGVDVFHPNSGEVRSDGAEGIACWFIDTDYNEESFFVRHAYFLGANDPYKSLKTTLKAEINEEAWESLHSDTSRPFPKPKSGRIAVKVINHLGDEVMKVYRVE